MYSPFPPPHIGRGRQIVCKNNVGFNFNENRKILNDSTHSVLNWPYYEQLLKNFQDNELSHLPYNKLWVGFSDIILKKKKKKNSSISMAPITKISQAKDAAISWTGLSTIRGLRSQQGTARPGLELSAFVTKAKFVLNNSTLLGMVTSPAKNPPKQCPPQMWVQNGHPWSNIYLFIYLFIYALMENQLWSTSHVFITEDKHIPCPIKASMEDRC